MFDEDGAEQPTCAGKSESIVNRWAGKKDADDQLVG
jgi:hypothetical protein